MPSLFFCGFGSAVGFLDGVSGSFASPQKTCRGAPAPLAVRNGRCVAKGGLVSFVGFMRRRRWACSLAPVDLQGRAGAPHPRPGAAAPGTPQKKQPLSCLPAFAPPPPGPTAHPDPAPPPAALPAAVRAIFLYRRPRFLRFLPSAPLAPSPNVKNGPQSRSFPFLPRRATPHGPPWDLRRWFWRRPSAPPRPPCSPWPPAGGRRDASRPPSPGLRPGLPVWRRGPRPRQPNAAPPAQRPCSPLPPGFRAYYRSFVCILAHVPYRCPYRAN